ncbi:MAG: prepilin-type N-terminal cleavage/methylation domain-containing protein [Oscillospiraceae bacterium]
MIQILHKLKQRKGFTLVELIVVVAIIGILAAILIPTMIGYVTNAQVMSANSTAASLKNSVDNFMTQADGDGYGMLKSASNLSRMNITIEEGDWTITRNGGSFGDTGALKWAENGIGTGVMGQDKTDAANCESLLAITLTDLFPEVRNGTFFVSVSAGKCVAVAYCRGRTTDLVEGVDYPTLDSDGKFPYNFAWNGSNAGISADGVIVGTAPIVPIG